MIITIRARIDDSSTTPYTSGYIVSPVLGPCFLTTLGGRIIDPSVGYHHSIIHVARVLNIVLLNLILGDSVFDFLAVLVDWQIFKINCPISILVRANVLGLYIISISL